ncbi:MAG: DUF4011 domain-containing protein [Anaerovoracaceae bacterium]
MLLKNSSETDYYDLRLRIESDTELVTPFEMGIDQLKAGEEVRLKSIKVKINGTYLASLTERVTCLMKAMVLCDEKVLVSEEKEIVALAFDQWPGLAYSPEILAAFSMPNHPAVTGLVQIASQYLEKWTGNPSMSGYQTNDPNRVKQMAASVYAAIQQKNITYVNPPSSFEEFGQRIRLADAVLDQHLGTCMDMTLLYVACLEAMGLNPIMVMMHGHIFAGVWLIADSFPDMIMDDPTHLEKRMAEGINEILVVECTAMNAGENLDFDSANKDALKHVADYERFEFVIDVARARSMGIRPLPVRVMTDAGYAVAHEERAAEDVTSAPKDLGETFDRTVTGEKIQATKQIQWERKLLDLSLRNMLINMRLTKAVVPLLANDLGIIEDALSDGEEFQVLPRPDNMSLPEEGISIDNLTDLGSFSEYIALEGKHKRLHSSYSEKELSACLTKLFRSAKTSLEENGASTLYLALGMLRWIDDKKSEGNARYAPIVLLPIDITRKSASKGYTMCMRDEDAQLNITLLEFLKKNFEIEISGLHPLPKDDHGVDLPKIFAMIRYAVLNQPGWDVVEAGLIGNFSFSQFVMWNDIHSHADVLDRNDIVRSLIHGAVDWDCSIPESVDSDEAYLPVTADSSQLRAINMAAAGVSFVLHGPPGTGKSQTITAMIANALTKGQTILFVAEKMAALEVVQKRLDALGIGDFCLELHSDKATKKSVLNQLKSVLELSACGERTEYDEKIRDIRGMRADLDAYVEKLHQKRSAGKSLRELIDTYESIPDEGVELVFDGGFASNLTQNDLDNQYRALSQLVAAGRAVGHPKGHPLSAVGQTEYSQTLKMELESTAASYQSSLWNMKESADAFSEALNLNPPVSAVDWRETVARAECVVSAEAVPAFLLSNDDLEKEFDLPLSYMKEKNSADERRGRLLQLWNDTFLQMDMSGYREKYDAANKKFFGKGRAVANLVKELQAFAVAPVDPEKIPALLAEIEVFQRMDCDCRDRLNHLPFEWKKILEEYDSEEKLEAYRDRLNRLLGAMDQLSIRASDLHEAGKLAECAGIASKVIDDYEILTNNEKALTELLQISFEESEENWIEARTRLCSSLTENAASIKDWIVYRQAEQMCGKLGLAAVCEAYRQGLAHEKVLNVYRRSIYRTMIMSVIESEPVLNSFTGNGFNERIVQFKKLDAEFIELTKKEVYYRLTRQLPLASDSVEVSRELNILRRAIASNGRGVSIRSLFEQIQNILSRLCPCMLMSPISVAQYMSVDSRPFDIVIFDEASQLPTCKAVGVLARGRNAVIVGDPNQMPPTNFFAGNMVDEENLDIEDLDSILDDCLALGMPSAHLKWHYRSRHESLIAFSNHEFYENSMLTFPSANDREKHVTLVKVDGHYDRKKGRVNEGEADAIVAEIKRRFSDEALRNESVGVVTFNLSQQMFIEDKLQEAFQADAALDRWANEGEDRLFVKNLENVQGDERDIILFSTTFGPDEEGKLSMNFGPLNNEGGWKRLNVAVSRARKEMKVFSSMTADMIDLRRTKAKGVEALKDFLNYAEKGNLLISNSDGNPNSESGILNRICSELETAGYQYQRNVGHSKFKVDLAVINPSEPEEYILGIMLDGDSYKQSSNTKDREVSQVSILKGLGWNIHRIWAMDWWDNKDREIAKLLELLRQKTEEISEKPLESAEEPAAAVSEVPPAAPEGLPEDEVCESETSEAGNGATSVDLEIPKFNEDPVLPEEQESVGESDAAPAPPLTEDPGFGDGWDTAPAPPLTEDLGFGDGADAAYTQPVPEAQSIIAGVGAAHPSPLTESTPPSQEYQCSEYISADVLVNPLSTGEYVSEAAQRLILEHMQAILDAEAPVAESRLIRRTLRSFDILRASGQTTAATEKVLQKLSCRLDEQKGISFYWRPDQNPETYYEYRIDAGIEDKRKPEEICPQELKNAVCVTLAESSPMTENELIKNTIRTMGYGRSGNALMEAVARGIRYGKNTGEIVQAENKTYSLGQK